MLIESYFHEEIRSSLVQHKLLRADENVESLIGRTLVVRFNLLKGDSLVKQDKPIDEYEVDLEGKLRNKTEALIVESIVSASKIISIDTTNYIPLDKISNYKADQCPIYMSNVKIYLELIVIGHIQASYLTITDKGLCLAYFDDDFVDDENLGNQVQVAKMKHYVLTEYDII